MKKIGILFETLFLKHHKLPWTDRLEKARADFSPGETLIFNIITFLFIATSLFMLYKVSNEFSTAVPVQGGSLREGIIGSPRFINPLLALSDTDRDITELVYAGLLTHDTDGNLLPLLAKQVSISEDGLTYTITLRDDIFFHDGTPVTADDVLFTIESARDPLIKSNKRAAFEGVTTETPNKETVVFHLKDAYAPFEENLTLGILPKHIWKNVSADAFSLARANTEPIGAGAYRLLGTEKDTSGVPTTYTFEAFKTGAEKKPFISSLILSFYPTEEAAKKALERGEIDSLASIAPIDAEELTQKGYRIERATLPRIFGVFWNQNDSPVLAYPEVRKALAVAIDNKEIIKNALHGFGVEANGPIPQSFKEGLSVFDNGTTTPQTILERNGWKKGADGIYIKTVKTKTDRLHFSVSTGNVPELVETATLLREAWQKMGAEVDVKIFELGDLNQNVIRPRKFDALLFGEIVGRDLDLYAFWHSSQRVDPGLNIALYTNTKTDGYLKDARQTTDPEKRKKLFTLFEQEIQKDRPALFLYSPDFMYVVPKDLGGTILGKITTPNERFLSIREWYKETERVWNIFVEKNE